MADVICRKKYLLIDILGVGAFGKVYKVYNNILRLYTAIKISKYSDGEKLENEIIIIKRLTTLDIPNVVKYYEDGYCQLLSNNRYYEMELLTGTLQSFIDLGNKIDSSQFYSITFELLYTLSIFRKYRFKHRDISGYNILYNIDHDYRKYQLLSGTNVAICSSIHPVISDFNTSKFEIYDTNNPLDYNDIIALVNVLVDLFNQVESADDITFQNIIDSITAYDDLSYMFLQEIADQVIDKISSSDVMIL